MFDIAPSEFLLVAFVALVVIGPKDLPKAMRVVGYWVGRARAVGRQFRSGFDEMVREAELEEMEKKWKAENERIMREHPVTPALPEPPLPEPAPAEPAMTMDDPPDADAATPPADAGDDAQGALPLDTTDRPVTVERPHLVPARDGQATPDDDAKAPS